MKLFSLMVQLGASLGGYAQDLKGRVVEQENGQKVALSPALSGTGPIRLR